MILMILVVTVTRAIIRKIIADDPRVAQEIPKETPRSPKGSRNESNHKKDRGRKALRHSKSIFFTLRITLCTIIQELWKESCVRRKGKKQTKKKMMQKWVQNGMKKTN